MYSIDARELKQFLQDTERHAISSARTGRISPVQADSIVATATNIRGHFLADLPQTLADLEPEEVAQHFGKHVQVIDRPEMTPIMLLAVRADEALVLIEDPLRFWPYTDTWPLDELIPIEPGQEQAPKAAGQGGGL